jgi:hypothetical protein
VVGRELISIGLSHSHFFGFDEYTTGMLLGGTAYHPLSLQKHDPIAFAFSDSAFANR